MNKNNGDTTLPSGWKERRLGDVATFINGDRGKNYPSQGAFVDEGIRFINAGHLQEGRIAAEKMNYIPESRYDLLGSGKIEQNDILYCLRGSLGKLAIVQTADRGAIASSLVIIRPSDECDVDYVFRYLDSPFGRKEIQRFDNGSAQPNLSAQSVKDYKIPLPPLSEQKRIAGILDKADSIIRKRQQAIGLTEQFLRSTFLDMFGDPVTNPKGWPVSSVADACVPKIGVKAGPFGSSLKKEFYTEKGYRIYGQEQVIGGDFSIGDYYIGEEKFQQLSSCEVKPGDLLISLVGSIGNTLVVPEGIERGIINPRLLRIRARPDVLCPVFLQHVLRHPHTQAELQRTSHGGTMAVLNGAMMKQLVIPLPPRVRQQEFEIFVRDHKQSQSRFETVASELDNLFNSLVQRAFRGEL